MMTPQEVADCTFAKAVMGGYNMAAVDDFLDKLTEDYSNLYKENATLKSKLKVVADKLKEYRDMEDAMRSALLTSQKMASSIVAEAEQRRDALIADAAGGAKARLREIQDQVEQEERRLEEVRRQVNRELEAEKQRLRTGQEELRAFVENVTAVCNDQLALLERLPALPVEDNSAPAPAEESASAPAEVSQEPPRPSEPGAADIARELADVFGKLDQEESGDSDQDPFADVPDGGEEENGGETRVMNLDDLQFGRNYTRK